MRLNFFRSIVLAMATFATAQGASATPTYHNIYTFCPGGTCGGSEGTHPQGALVMDASGNFYGTTQNGGAYGFGTVYEVSPDGMGGWTYRTLHSFCQDTTNCPDGGQPVSALVIDTSGNLYGTTSYYGHTGTGYGGTAFKITHVGRPSPTFKVIYTFCSLTGCADGTHVNAGLSYAGAASGAYDGTSPLFGTTVSGGTGLFANGVVFKLEPPAGSGTWNETVLYNMCSVSGCIDGANPSSGVLVDGSGNLYGTAGTGAFGSGEVYQLAPSGGGYSESVVYNFCATPVSGCPDGKSPAGNLVLDSTGNKFFGTTGVGGSQYSTDYSDGAGVAFELDRGTSCPVGTVPQWCETVLHNFCTSTSCADGFWPADGGLAIDSSGVLYGLTQRGGASWPAIDGGVAYKLSGAHHSSLHVLHSFCSSSGCADGASPDASLIVDTSGTVYGTTPSGGDSFGEGTVFSITP
jgi:uncharacterized repeat protein (TIGR03803 family)